MSAKHTASSWNATHGVGTRVRYWTVMPPADGTAPIDTFTRSESWDVSGRPVVLIEGRSGGVALTHLQVLV